MRTKNSSDSRGQQTRNESGRSGSSSDSKKSNSGSHGGRGSQSGDIPRDANGRFKSTK